VRAALAPLRAREFRLLFTARTTSFLGNGMAPVALAFAVLDLTGSTSDLGFVLAVRQGAVIAFLLVGGVWADRLPRHLVMVASNLVSGASQAVLAALLLAGRARLWEVLGLGRNASLILGAALGGIVVGASSPGVAIAVDAGSFLAAAVLLGGMRLPAGLRMESSNVIAEAREGWREFRSPPWLWAIVLQFSFIVAAENGALGTLGPVVAKELLGGAAVWGAVLASESAGLILGGLAMLRFRPRRLLLTATLGVFAMPARPVRARRPARCRARLRSRVAAGLGIEVFGVLWETTMQQEIPAEKLSRVSAFDALGSFVLMPLGFVAIPPIAAALGDRATFLGVGALIVVTTLAVLLVEDVRTLERRDVVSAADAEGAATV